MAKIQNTKRQPLDIEIVIGEGKNQKRKVVNLGPKGVSGELTAEELKAPQVKANLRAGNIVIIETAATGGKAKTTKGEGDKE